MMSCPVLVSECNLDLRMLLLAVQLGTVVKAGLGSVGLMEVQEGVLSWLRAYCTILKDFLMQVACCLLPGRVVSLRSMGLSLSSRWTALSFSVSATRECCERTFADTRVGTHSYACAAVALALAREANNNKHLRATRYQPYPVLGLLSGGVFMALAVCLGVASGLSVLPRSHKYLASIVAVLCGTVAMHLLTQYPRGFAILPVATVALVAEKGMGLYHTVWTQLCLEVSCDLSLEVIAGSQLDWALACGQSQLLHSSLHKTHISELAKAQLWVCRAVRKYPYLGFCCIRVSQDAFEAFTKVPPPVDLCASTLCVFTVEEDSIKFFLQTIDCLNVQDISNSVQESLRLVFSE